MDLSVVIVSYNVKKLLVECLRSVFSEVDSLEIEVFVVDNASKDGTVEQIRKEFPSVIVIDNNENVGFPAANNQAINISSGELILLLNPDTFIKKGALSELEGFFRHQKGGIVVGMNVQNEDSTYQHTAHAIPSSRGVLFSCLELHRLFPKISFFNPDLNIEIDSRLPTRIGWVSGAALAFNRILLDHVGYLDENLFWMEDVDFCYRAYKAGFPVYYLPSASVTHFIGKSASKNIRRVLYHQHVSKINFVLKHYGWIFASMLRVLFFIELLIKISVRLFQLIEPNKRSENRNRISGYISVIKYIVWSISPEWT